MAKNDLEDYDWHLSPAAKGLDKTLANKLSSLQQSIGKQGLSKTRYADSIRQALADGRLKQQQIGSDLSGKLQNLLERLAAKGLAKSGAKDLLSGKLAAEAEAERKKAEAAAAAAIRKAQQQMDQLTAEQALNQQEILRLLRQAGQK